MKATVRCRRIVVGEQGSAEARVAWRHDPRDVHEDLVRGGEAALGGAGPVHAADLPREMDMPLVVVPPYPGLPCALGLLVSDLRADGSASRRLCLNDATTADIRASFVRVEQALREGPAVSSRPDAGWRASCSVDMRYLGQSFDLPVPVDDTLAQAFDREHERIYGFATPSAPKEIVCFRVSLEAPAGLTASQLPKYPVAGAPKPVARRRVFFREGAGSTSAPSTSGRASRPGRGSADRRSSSRWTPPRWSHPPSTPRSTGTRTCC